MGIEEDSPGRFVIVGTVLVGGIVLGFVLVATFHWYPYYWQWLAYHNALVVAVVLYLLLAPKDVASMPFPRSSTRLRSIHGTPNDYEVISPARWGE